MHGQSSWWLEQYWNGASIATFEEEADSGKILQYAWDMVVGALTWPLLKIVELCWGPAPMSKFSCSLLERWPCGLSRPTCLESPQVHAPPHKLLPNIVHRIISSPQPGCTRRRAFGTKLRYDVPSSWHSYYWGIPESDHSTRVRKYGKISMECSLHVTGT